MGDRVSLREAGRRLGLAHQVIDHHVKAGKLSGPGDDCKYDFDQLRHEYAENLDPTARKLNAAQLGIVRLGAQGRNKSTPPKVQAAARLAAADADNRDTMRALPNLTQARTAYTASQAQLAGLKLKREKGLLIERAAVERAARTLGQLVRDRIMSLPDRLAGVLDRAGVEDVRDRCRALLEEIDAELGKIEAMDAEGA